MFGRGVDTRSISLDTCLARQPEYLGVHSILHPKCAQIEYGLSQIPYRGHQPQQYAVTHYWVVMQ